MVKDGYITVTNKKLVNSKVSGNIKVRFKIPLRNTNCDKYGLVQHTGMKAVLIIATKNYKEKYTAEALSFKLSKYPDTIGITCGLVPTYDMPDGLAGTSYNGNPDDYYWVSFSLFSYWLPYQRKVTGIDISAIFAGTGTIIHMTTEHLIAPRTIKKNTLWKTGETPPPGYTITKNTFNYTSKDNLEIDVILAVMYKISDFEGTEITIEGEMKYLLEGAVDYQYPDLLFPHFPIVSAISPLYTEIQLKKI